MEISEAILGNPVKMLADEIYHVDVNFIHSVGNDVMNHVERDVCEKHEPNVKLTNLVEHYYVPLICITDTETAIQLFV